MQQATQYGSEQTAKAGARGVLTPVRIKALVAGLAVGAALAGAGEYALVQAEATKTANQQTQLAALELEVAELERLIGSAEEYETFKLACEHEQTEFEHALEAVPSEAELAAALTDIEAVMKGTGVDLVSFVPGKTVAPNLAATSLQQPEPAKPAKPAKGETAAAPPPPVSIQGREIAVVVRASFRSYQNLLNALAGHTRVLTTEAFQMVSSDGGGSYSLQAKMALRVYFKQAPQAAGEIVK